MTDDIVTRLEFLLQEGASIISEQADEIERLRTLVGTLNMSLWGQLESCRCHDKKSLMQKVMKAVRGE